MQSTLRQLHLALLAAILAIAGCGGEQYEVVLPAVDPQQGAAQAMELYDANGDGALDLAESEKVPSLLDQRSLIDIDGDGRVSREELAARLSQLQQEMGLTDFNVTVIYANKPLVGAQLRMIPEAFHGSQFQPATGETDAGGVAAMTIADEHFPPELRGGRYRGLHRGLYRVEVTHPTIKLPARYNTETTLGFQVMSDAMNEPAVLDLQPR